VFKTFVRSMAITVYLYMCTWPLAINFADMPINILSLSYLSVCCGYSIERDVGMRRACICMETNLVLETSFHISRPVSISRDQFPYLETSFHISRPVSISRDQFPYVNQRGLNFKPAKLCLLHECTLFCSKLFTKITS